MSVRVRQGIAVHGAFLLFGVLIAAFFPFFALFLDDRGLSASEIGVAISAMALARVVFNPMWGHLADTRLGRRQAFRLGVAGATVAGLLLFLLGNTFEAVLVTAFLIAAASGAAGSNLDALALAYLGEHSADYGRIRGWESLSYAVAAVAFGFALEAAGVHWALAFYSSFCAVSFLWAGTLERDPPRHSEGHGRLGAVGAVFREAPRFWLFLLASLLLWVGFTGAWNFIALRIHSRGGGPLLVAIGAALGGGMEVPIMRLSSRLSRRVGLRIVYVMGCGVYVLGFLLWGIVNDPVALSILTLLEGVGFALVFTSSVVVVGRMVPPSLHATAQSVSTSVGFGIAPMLGGATGGLVYQHLGQTTLYVGASAMAAAGGLVAWLALSAPAFTRPEPIEVAAVPPHGPEAG